MGKSAVRRRSGLLVRRITFDQSLIRNVVRAQSSFMIWFLSFSAGDEGLLAERIRVR